RTRRPLLFLLPLVAIAADLAPLYLGIRLAFVVIALCLFVLLEARPGTAATVVLALCLIFLPAHMDRFERGILFDIALYALLGIGLNVVVGYAGLLDLGYVAFFAVGAYLYALGAAPLIGGGFGLGLSFWTVLPVALLLTAAIGGLLGLPVLRLRGDYLAIVTLGCGDGHRHDPLQAACVRYRRCNRWRRRRHLRREAERHFSERFQPRRLNKCAGARHHRRDGERARRNPRRPSPHRLARGAPGL